MRSFAAALLAASTIAVPIKDAGDSIVLDNLNAKVADKVEIGAITVIDGEDDFFGEDDIDFDFVVPVYSEGEQVAAVIDQIEGGFEKIDAINMEVEAEQMDDLLKEQQDEIEAILEDAEDEAAEVIEEYSDASSAAEEVEELIEEAAELIYAVNIDHDIKVAEAAKTSIVAEITNDTIKDKLMEDVVDFVSLGADINDIVAEQNLPFKVQTPSLIDDSEAAESKLDRIVCRSGECVDDIKKDPEFDSFLSGVLSNFEAHGEGRDFGAGHFGRVGSRPTGPTRP
jgi:hypothetical protein